MNPIDVISHEQWAWIAPLLPSSAGKRGGQWRDHRQVLAGIAWKFRTGAPWRDLPAAYGPWQTAWKRHNLWSADGTYHQLVTAAQARADADGGIDWLVGVDSSLVRAHQHAAGARHHRGLGRITRSSGLTSPRITASAGRVAGPRPRSTSPVTVTAGRWRCG